MTDRSEVIKRYRKGVLLRNYSGQLSYEIADRGYEAYKPAKRKVSKHFRLLPMGITINGLDESFQSYFKGAKRVGIEWDIWSGLIFVAKNERAEPLIREIAMYCEGTEI